jgi:NADH:ubiquinone oxidoreductase subunit H
MWRGGFPLVVARTSVVALLIPVILLAGVIALVAVPAVIASRHAVAAIHARRGPALAPVLHLDVAHAEPSVGIVSRGEASAA